MESPIGHLALVCGTVAPPPWSCSCVVDEAAALSRSRGAVTLWLEAPKVNVPAIRAYERRGFAGVDLDLTLYQGTVYRDDVAVFMAKSLDGKAPMRCRDRP